MGASAQETGGAAAMEVVNLVVEGEATGGQPRPILRSAETSPEPPAPVGAVEGERVPDEATARPGEGPPTSGTGTPLRFSGDAGSRIWNSVDPTRAAPTDAEIMRLRLVPELERLIDSAAAEEERLREAMNWTHEDGNGGRWGTSPTTVFMGPFSRTLCGGELDPADCGLGILPWKRESYNQENQALREIRSQAQTMEIRKNWAERAATIRTRARSARDTVRLRADTLPRPRALPDPGENS